MSALFRSAFYTRMKRYWGENISIYRMRKLLFLKRGISHQLGREAVVRFECENSAIDVIINFLWKIFHTPIVLVVLTTANFGGFSNFCRYYTRSQTGKSTGPLWNPWLRPPFLDKARSYFLLLTVICNSLLLLKSLPINVINCIKFYVNCSTITGAYDKNICLFICKSSPMIHCSNRSFLSHVTNVPKWMWNDEIIGSKGKSCCNRV